MGQLWEFTKTLAAVAVLGAILWYGYSLWNQASPVDDETVYGASFNCRKALADLASGYTCRDSANCAMTDYELDQLKKLETNISIFCD